MQKIIDVGGGDSRLADCLLEKGFEHITVLDISEKAIDKAKERLGSKAKKINWLVCDITAFQPAIEYDVWHDRATFHFLTTKEQVEKYITLAKKAVKSFMIIGTFSTNGPLKCSGLEIKQYAEETLEHTFEHDFEKIRCITENHITPFNTAQNFLFCSFKKKKMD